MTPVLQFDHVGKTYCGGDEQVRVLVDFKFILEPGEFVVLTGPSEPENRRFCILPAGWMHRTAALNCCGGSGAVMTRSAQYASDNTLARGGPRMP